MKKFFIYGAGQIGTHIVDCITHSNYEGVANVFLYAPHNYKRVEAACEDLKDAQALADKISRWKFQATGNVDDMEGSDVIFFCAGKHPQQEEYARALEQGIDDRLLQAVQNIELVNQFCDEVNRFCPKAKVFIVTNPVDLMTEIARKQLPEAEVYGLGCYLDTARFRREFAEVAQAHGLEIYRPEVYAWIFGHHCGTMFLHRYSFLVVGKKHIPQLEELIEKALTNTRNRGLTITQMSCAATTAKINNGAFFAPATMVAKVMKAIVEEKSLILPLNRPIIKDDGVGMVGKSAQLLCKIEGLEIIPMSLPFFDEDIQSLQHSMEEYEKGKIALARFIK